MRNKTGDGKSGMIARFQKGSATYRCSMCGRMTREVSAGDAATRLCRHCIEITEWLNFIENGGSMECVPAKYRAEIEKIENES